MIRGVMDKLLEMQVKAEEKATKTYNQIYLQVSHKMIRPKMYIFLVRGH
jgi:hypothetical protein